MAEQRLKFETERTRHFRGTKLSDSDDRTISNIEDFGCTNLHIKADAVSPQWSYTIGVYDTCGKPELVTIGLLQETAQYLLNKAAEEMRRGIDLTIGRHLGMINQFEVEFRPVDPKWVKHLMGWAIWYYGGEEFPVLQAVYPDRENRFPEDPDFEAYFRQPLLQSGAPMTVLEEDFWASTDPSSSLFDWKFSEPPHTRVFLSQPVHSGEEDVTYVSHDEDDGAWQFLGDSMSADKDPVISCFHHSLDKDPSLKELADLPLGWCAERSRLGEPWVRSQRAPEDGEDEHES